MKRKALVLACAVVMAMSMCVTAFAQEPNTVISPEVTSSEISETSAGDPAAAEQETADSKVKEDSNLSLYLIAGCAVTGFVVVAVVCKKKGRNK